MRSKIKAIIDSLRIDARRPLEPSCRMLVLLWSLIALAAIIRSLGIALLIAGSLIRLADVAVGVRPT